VLVDEQFGRHVLEQAKEQKIARILTVEKSGLQEFDFEYGDKYKDHLLEFRPEFAKALLRYNPDGDQEHNEHSRARLKELSDFCHSENIRLLVEPLVPPTPDQLMKVDGDKTRYDEEMRGILTVRLMAEMYDAGIEVDVWKVEGFTSEANYQLVTLQAHVGGRTDTGVVVLGRAETTEKVTEWIRAGSHVPGVIGFAVGRTIFWDPLAKLKSGEIDHKIAVKEMADRYQHFYQVFKGKR
jgi:5-dehydro-2-deoxygluconokinase